MKTRMKEKEVYFAAVTALTSAVNDYFILYPDDPFHYWELGDLKDPNSNELLETRTREIVDGLRDKFMVDNRTDCLVELARNPLTQRLVVWMSTQGEHFDPEKVK